MRNKLSQFWQELKRRRVIHVITVYASATFVIIELINNLTEPLNLPSNLATIVIIVLSVGFPMAVILSWLYDLTGEGIEKTKPVEEIKEDEKTAVPGAWKIATYVSFVFILALVTFNIVGGKKGLRPGDVQSLVILPFDNFTGDEQLDYVAEGLHASLIGDLGRIGGLRVISQTTATVYKNMEISLPMIAKEANVEAIVEPTLMCYGDSVCVQIRVIAMYPEEREIWVSDYKEDKSQILNLYNRITKQIADEMLIELSPEAERFLAKSRTVDREVYDAYLRGYSYIGDLSQESLFRARDYLNGAIEKNPDWAPLYAAMATVWQGIVVLGAESPENANPIIYENLNKALELDPDLVEAHYVSAFMAMTAEWDWVKSEKEFLKALSINPNHVISRMHYSHLLYSLQRTEEASAHASQGYKLDPLNPLIQTDYGWALLQGGDCDSALAILENVLVSDPDNSWANNLIQSVAFKLGDLDRVFKAEKHILPFKEEVMNEIEKIYVERGFNASYEEIMRQLEILAEKSYVAPADLAFRYYWINRDDKAMEWIEKGAEVRDPNIISMGTGSVFTRLYDNPRFIKVFEKLKLPLPDK